MNGAAQFQAWLRSQHPSIYQHAMRDSPLSGVSETIANFLDRVSTTANSVASTYLEGKARLELLRLNIARARQDLAPIATVEDLAKIPPAVRATASATGDSFPLLPVVMLGVAALFLFRR